MPNPEDRERSPQIRRVVRHLPVDHDNLLVGMVRDDANMADPAYKPLVMTQDPTGNVVFTWILPNETEPTTFVRVDVKMHPACPFIEKMMNLAQFLKTGESSGIKIEYVLLRKP